MLDNILISENTHNVITGELNMIEKHTFYKKDFEEITWPLLLEIANIMKQQVTIEARTNILKGKTVMKKTELQYWKKEEQAMLKIQEQNWKIKAIEYIDNKGEKELR